MNKGDATARGRLKGWLLAVLAMLAEGLAWVRATAVPTHERRP